MADVEQEPRRIASAHRLAQFTRRGQDAVGLAVEAVGQQIAIPSRATISSRSGGVLPTCTIGGRLPVACWICLAMRRVADRFHHHAAAHARLDADDEAGMAPDGLPGRGRIDVCRIRQLVLAQQADAGDVEQGMHPGLAGGGDALKSSTSSAPVLPASMTVVTPDSTPTLSGSS